MISEIPVHPRLIKANNNTSAAALAPHQRMPQLRTSILQQDQYRSSRDAAISEITACNPRTGHVSLMSQQFSQLNQQKPQLLNGPPAVAPKPKPWTSAVNSQALQFSEPINASYNQNSIAVTNNYPHHLHQFQERINCQSPPLPPPPPPPPVTNKVTINTGNHLLSNFSLATPSTPSNPNVSSLGQSPHSSDLMPPALLNSQQQQQQQQQMQQHQQPQQRLQMNNNQPRHLFGQCEPTPQARQSMSAKRSMQHNVMYSGQEQGATDHSSLESFGFQNVTMPRDGDDQTVQYIDSSNEYRRNGRASFTSSNIASGRIDSVMAARKSLLVKRPSNQYLSLLYFLFHIALSICLIQASDATWQESSTRGTYFHQIIVFYLSYLISTSIVFIFLIRCCKNEYIFSENFKPGRQSVIFYGSVVLGIIHLATISFDLAACTHKTDLVLLILHFVFVFFLLHFIFSQARYGLKLGFSNIAIAHILSTQISIFMVNFDHSYGSCGYPPVLSPVFPNSTEQPSIIQSLVAHLEPVNTLVEPITLHYQLLSIFVVASLWSLNNNIDAITALTSGISGLISDAGHFSYSEFFIKHTSLKGFFFGLLGLTGSVVVLTLKDHELSLMLHTILQGTSAMASVIALFLRKEKLMMKTFYQPFFTSNSLTSAPDHHIIINLTALTTYYCSICMIIGNLVTANSTLNILAISDGICMLFHITLQTFLIRSGERRKTSLQRQFFAFLILSNLSIWMIEIVQVSSKLAHVSALDSPIIMPLLMSLNRLYSVLLFIHFWKSK